MHVGLANGVAGRANRESRIFIIHGDLKVIKV
jgi:hypothetical protein